MEAGSPARLIGPEGGTVLYEGVRLSIPAGALETRVEITIERTGELIPEGYVGFSPVYRFSPAGLTFRQPVTVTLPFDGDRARAGIYWSNTSGVGYARVGGSINGDTITATVSHFSLCFVGAPVAPTDATPMDGPGDATTDATPVDSSGDAATDTAPIDAATPTDAASDGTTPTDLPPPDACAECAPRPVAPQSLSLATARRPTFRWVLPAGVDGVHVDLCRDRALATGCLSLDATGDHTAPGVDLGAGTWFWRLRARVGGVIQPAAGPTWLFRVGARGSSTDTSIAPTLDVNGDGYSDLVVGDATSNSAWVHHGGPSGIPTAATANVSCASIEACGELVASAGDINGDGYADVFVRGGGALRLHLGGASGLSPTAAQTLDVSGTVWISLAGVGDVDRDGYADVLLGRSGALSIYYGSAAGLVERGVDFRCETPGGCGGKVRAAGDINGDGYADVIVGATSDRYEVHLGAAGGLTSAPQVVLGARPNFSSVAGVGDINNDGYGDIAGFSVSEGGLFFSGTATGLDPAADTLPGRGPAAAGADIDGDGYTDLVIAHGGVVEYPGTATGVRGVSRSGATVLGSTPSQVVTGDYNGDGRADVALGTTYAAWPATASAGAVGVALGSASGFGSAETRAFPERGGFALGLALAAGTGVGLTELSSMSAGQGTAYLCGEATTNCQLLPHLAGQGFGASVAYASIADRGSSGNYLIGAPLAGRVYVMPVTTRVIADLHDNPFSATLTGSASERFGAAVSAAGDVNNDGVRDVIVGAPGGSRAYVYLGSGSGYGAPIPLVGASGTHFGRVVSGARDVNRDGYADVLVSSDLGVHVFLGGSSGTRTTAAVTWTGAVGSGFGAAMAGVGDVNGDGFADVAVGAPGAASAMVYYGAATLPATASLVLTGAAGSEFGAAVRGAGDQNLDGVSDLIIGAPGAASVYVYYGGATGVATTAAATLTRTAGSRFGAAIAWSGESDAVTTLQNNLAVGAPGTDLAIYYYSRYCDSRNRCALPSTPVATRSIAAGTDSAYGGSVAVRALGPTNAS